MHAYANIYAGIYIYMHACRINLPFHLPTCSPPPPACTPDGMGITYNEHVNLAVAVAIDGGLITPALKDADTTDLY